MNARLQSMNAEEDKVTAGKLLEDLKMLAADTEALVKATAGETGQHVVRMRAKAGESLMAAKACVADAQEVALARARSAGRATDAYAHANPWQVMALGAVAGLAMGLLLSSSATTDS